MLHLFQDNVIFCKKETSKSSVGDEGKTYYTDYGHLGTFKTAGLCKPFRWIFVEFLLIMMREVAKRHYTFHETFQ